MRSYKMNIRDMVSDSCDYLSEVLGTNIDRDSNIFECGANSIIAIKWVSYIWKKYKLKVDYNLLFDFNTVEAVISELVKSNDSGIDSTETLENISKDNQAQRAPLSSPQKGIWMYDLMHTESKFVLAAYTLIEGPLSISKMVSAIEAVVEDNDIFRIKFRTDSKGNTYQKIDNEASTKERIRVINVSSISEASVEAERLCNVKWDIESELPFVILIASVNETLHCLYYIIHHIVADEETFEIVNRQVINRYFDDNSADRPRSSYLKYCGESSSVDNGEIIKYWNGQLTKDKLNDYSCLSFSNERSELEFAVSTSIIKKLVKYAAEEKTSLYSAFLCVVLVALYLQSGRRKFFISTAISDRLNYCEYVDTCGMFVNNVLLELDVNYKKTFTEIMAIVKEKVSSAKKHSRLAIDDLIAQSSQIDKTYLRMQNDIVFNFIDFERKNLCRDGLTIHPMKYMVNPENRLNIYIQNIGGSYICNLDSITDEMSLDDLEEIRDTVCRILESNLFESNTEIINY